MKKKGKTLNCLICDKEFYVKRCLLQKKKFCSKECHNIFMSIYNKNRRHTEESKKKMTSSNRLKSVVSLGNRKVYKGVIPYYTALKGRR